MTSEQIARYYATDFFTYPVNERTKDTLKLQIMKALKEVRWHTLIECYNTDSKEEIEALIARKGD